jgi:hypothetical protein
MRNIAIVAFKIAAVFVLLFALRSVPAVLAKLMGAPITFDFALLANLFMFVAPTAIAVALWVAAVPLARRLFPPDAKSPLLALEPAELQAVAFSVVGVTLLASSVRDIVWALAYFVESGPNMPWLNIVAGTAAATFTVLIGVWLLLGSRGIVGTIRRLRGR